MGFHSSKFIHINHSSDKGIYIDNIKYFLYHHSETLKSHPSFSFKSINVVHILKGNDAIISAVGHMQSNLKLPGQCQGEAESGWSIAVISCSTDNCLQPQDIQLPAAS